MFQILLPETSLPDFITLLYELLIQVNRVVSTNNIEILDFSFHGSSELLR